MADVPGRFEATTPERFVARRLEASDVDHLAELFREIAADPTADRFHPHDFDWKSASAIAGYKDQDLYVGLFRGESLLAYGMLRGWDAGYAVPSLGIYLAPRIRGLGLSKLLMQDLHDRARQAGAKKIRLKVYKNNISALGLYQRLGYTFLDEEGEQYVGLLDIVSSKGDER